MTDTIPKSPIDVNGRVGLHFDLAALYQELVADDELAGFEVPRRFYEIGSFDESWS